MGLLRLRTFRPRLVRWRAKHLPVKTTGLKRGVRNTPIPPSRYPNNFPGGQAVALSYNPPPPSGTKFFLSETLMCGEIPDNIILSQECIDRIGNENDPRRMKRTPRTTRTYVESLCRDIYCPSKAKKDGFCCTCFNKYDPDQEAAQVCICLVACTVI